MIDCRAALATLLLREFRWQEAETEFRAALERSQDGRRHEVLLVGLGEALQARGRLQEAARGYEEALRLNPGSLPALGHLAIARRAQGDLEGAVSAWTAYLEKRPRESAAVERLEEVVRLEAELRLLEESVRKPADIPEAWEALGRVRSAAGDRCGALEALGRAAELSPRDPSRALRLALAALGAGRVEEGRISLQRALDLDPDRTAAYAHLARLEELEGDRAGERRIWERLVERRPFDLVALRRLVEIDELAGRLPRAEREAARRAAGRGAGASSALVLGLIRAAAGDPAGAEEALALALEREPNEPSVALALADLLRSEQAAGRRKRQVGGAREAAERSAGPRPSALGLALLELHRALAAQTGSPPPEAVGALVKAHPGRADLLALLGDALAGQGRAEEARGEYARALELDPEERFAHLGLALAALRSERHEEAARRARAVLKRRPRDPYALSVLATACWQSGRLEEAEAAARAALDVDPWEQATSTRFLLARTLLARGDLRAAEEVVRGDLPRAAWLMYDQAWSFARSLFLRERPASDWEAWRRRAGTLGGGEEEALPRIAELLAWLEDRYTRLRTPEETLEKYFARRPDSPLLVAGKTSEANRAVIARRLGENLAYLRLADFQSPELSTVVKQVLEGLRDAPGLVLDLRGNSGGLRDEAVKVAEMLLPPGTLLGFEERLEGRAEVRSGAGSGVYADRPLVVLVDDGTASAAEALASMLQSAGRATVVGDPTQGKGVAQAVRLLPGGYSLLVTASQTLDPTGLPLHGRGVVPEISAPGDPSSPSDPALEKAQELLAAPP